MAVFKYEYRVGLTDIGKSNKLTNKAIIKILENAGSVHSESVGLGLNDIPRTNISWIVLGWKIKVISRVNYNEQLVVKTWGRDYNKVTMFRDYEIYDSKENLIAIATSKWAMINAKTGKLELIEKEQIEKYESEDKKVFDEEINFKLKDIKQSERELYYAIQRRDIDINNHVHNLYYLDFAYEILPKEVYEEGENNNIEIMYKKEIKLGEKIKLLYQYEDANIVSIKSEDEKILHAIVKLY